MGPDDNRMLADMQNSTLPGGDATHDELRACCARLALEHAELRAALIKLVALKDQKDASEADRQHAIDIGAFVSLRTGRALQDYEERMPMAWEQARETLRSIG